MANSVELVWVTPDAEKLIAYCARVSNPQNQTNPDYSKLLSYCIKHNHWSIFEMASMCLEINTQRDIAAQILRHRSFSFQEFSQRYQDASQLGYSLPQLREQDLKNRQNSLSKDYPRYVYEAVQSYLDKGQDLYSHLLSMGVAKETARRLLPVCQNTRLYMSGSIRSWLHYIQVRTDPSTQLEHRQIAQQAKEVLTAHLPTISQAMFSND